MVWNIFPFLLQVLITAPWQLLPFPSRRARERIICFLPKEVPSPFLRGEEMISPKGKLKRGNSPLKQRDSCPQNVSHRKALFTLWEPKQLSLGFCMQTPLLMGRSVTLLDLSKCSLVSALCQAQLYSSFGLQTASRSQLASFK